MPKRKQRTRKKGPNPYLPSLLAMGQHWAPRQIAEVISTLDNADYSLSEAIVLNLSRMPQAQYNGTAQPLDGFGPLGACDICKTEPMSLIVQVGKQGLKVCDGCYDGLEIPKGKGDVHIEDGGEGSDEESERGAAED